MKTHTLTTIAARTAGRLDGADAQVSAVTTDSRDIPDGALFVALRGEHKDGHLFVADAIRAGAEGVMVDEAATLELPAPAVRVADTGRALLDLASAERDDIAARVVAITGANGKTSTKDLTAAALAGRYRVHASPRSFNTEVGVPLTVLQASSDTEVLVLELGARHVGDVRLLSAVTRPDVVVVTNVGVAHMEIFGSWKAIVDASAEPIEALGSGDVAILSSDDRVVRGYRSRTQARVRTFGLAGDADVRAEDLSLDASGRASFMVHAGQERASVRLSIPGEHMVQNALAAISTGLELDVSLDEAAAAVGSARVSAWRMETFETGDGIVVVNDSYNANPESMAAGLKTARWIARDSRLIAVLGHMAELGPISLVEHERLGDLAARLRVDHLVTVGEAAQPIAMAALREGIEPEHVVHVATATQAVQRVREIARTGDVVFLKGSRVAGLERIAATLRGEEVPA